MPRLPLAALAALLLLPAAAGARTVDLAVIGDIPYGDHKIAVFSQNIQQINADPSVTSVIHVGDIKNGSSRCDTSYFNLIRSDFNQFADPLVYTPGDNEWTDCHRANNGGYQPAGPVDNAAPVQTPATESRLDAVRRIFFDRPGHTLGGDRTVTTQGDPVENVRWNEAGVPFATMNVPGSNNDLLPWYGDVESPALKALQADEYKTRNAADLKWLKDVFKAAKKGDAPAVVVAIQADMWDPAIIGDSTQYSGFTDFVRLLAKEAGKFGGPVLLLNGDSHVYESDRPLADPASPNNRIYGVDEAVPNLLRITVDGSSNANDYLKLHVNPDTPGVFTWERIPYTTP